MAFTLMGTCFPTVSGQIRIRELTGRGIEDASYDIEPMSRPQHRRRRLAACIGVERGRGEGSDPPPPSEAERGLLGALLGGRPRRSRVILVNARRPQSLRQPPLAVATPQQRTRSRLGESRIVDVSKSFETRDQSFDRRRP